VRERSLGGETLSLSAGMLVVSIFISLIGLAIISKLGY
jgi:hypothetical protein